MSLGVLGDMLVKVVADFNPVTVGINTLTAKVDALGQRFAVLTSGASAGVSGLTAMLLGSGGLALAIGATTHQAAMLEQAYTTLRRVTGLTADETDRLATNLKRLAQTTPGVSLQELNGIATFAGRMGVGGNTAKGRIEGISQFTAALAKVKIALDDMPIEETATSMARTLNVFHLGVDNASRFASALVKLDNASTATGQELLAIVSRLSGVGSTLHATIPSLLGLAAAMRDAGVETDSGSTAVGQLMMRMAGDSRKFATAVGADWHQMARLISTEPVQAVELFLSSLKKFTPERQTQILAGLHMQGRMSGQILLQLAQNMSGLSGLVAQANKEWEDQTAIQQGVALGAGTLNAQLQGLWNRLQLIGAEIGQHLIPIAKALTKAFGQIADDALAGLQHMGPQIQSWTGWLAEGARHVGIAFREWQTILKLAVEIVREKLEQLVVVMARIGSRGWESFVSGLSGVKSALAGFAEFIVDLFSQVFKTLSAKMSNMVLDAIRGLGGKIPDWLAKPLGKLWGVEPEAVREGINNVERVEEPKLVPNFNIGKDEIGAFVAMPLQAMIAKMFLRVKDANGNLVPPDLGAKIGLFEGLPNRKGGIDKLVGHLRRAQDARDAEDAKPAEAPEKAKHDPRWKPLGILKLFDVPKKPKNRPMTPQEQKARQHIIDMNEMRKEHNRRETARQRNEARLAERRKRHRREQPFAHRKKRKEATGLAALAAARGDQAGARKILEEAGIKVKGKPTGLAAFGGAINEGAGKSTGLIEFAQDLQKQIFDQARKTQEQELVDGLDQNKEATGKNQVATENLTAALKKAKFGLA